VQGRGVAGSELG